MTLDIDVAYLEQEWERVGLPRDEGLIAPLTMLDKDLLLDFDARFDGGDLAVLASDDDSTAARLILETVIRESPTPIEIPEAVRTHLLAVARSMPNEHDRNVTDGADGGEVDAWKFKGTEEDFQVWLSLFDKALFKATLAAFTFQYLPLVRLPRSRSTAIVKYRYLGTGARIRPGLFGLARTACAIEAPDVHRAARTHFRVVAPSGTLITNARLLSVDDPHDAQDLRLRSRDDEYQVRVSPERGVLYVGRKPTAGAYFATFTMLADTREFLRPALSTAAVGMVLLLLGATGEAVDKLLSQTLSREAEAAVLILLAIPSAFALTISRRSEHPVRSELLKWPRYALLSTVPLTAGAAILLLFSAVITSSALTLGWAFAGSWNFLIFAYMCVITISVAVERVSSRRRGSHTKIARIVALNRLPHRGHHWVTAALVTVITGAAFDSILQVLHFSPGGGYWWIGWIIFVAIDLVAFVFEFWRGSRSVA